MPTLQATRDVYCPFTQAIPLVQRFYAASRVRVGPFSYVTLEVESQVVSTRDLTDPTRDHDALVVEWHVHGPLPLPRFRGLITARPNGICTTIHIQGHYTPPFGIVGRVLDTILGRQIARRTLERLLDRVAGYIDASFGKEHMLSPDW